MCDPLTLLSVVGGAFGAKAAAPPPPPKPAPIANEALEDTGAEIELGGSKKKKADAKKATTRGAAAKTGKTGLASTPAQTGIKIL